jgi:hypothetical protein
MDEDEILKYALSQCSAYHILALYDSFIAKDDIRTLQALFEALLNRVVVNGDTISNIDLYNDLLERICPTNSGSSSENNFQCGGGNDDVQPSSSSENNHPPLSEQDEEDRFVTLLNSGFTHNNRKIRYKRRQTNFKLHNAPPNVDPLQWIRRANNEVLLHVSSNVPSNAKVGFSMHNRDDPNSSLNMSFRRKDQLDVDVILACIEKKMLSNESFFTEGEIVARYDYIDVPVGMGRKQRRSRKYNDFVKSKNSIIAISNNSDFGKRNCYS